MFKIDLILMVWNEYLKHFIDFVVFFFHLAPFCWARPPAFWSVRLFLNCKTHLCVYLDYLKKLIKLQESFEADKIWKLIEIVMISMVASQKMINIGSKIHKLRCFLKNFVKPLKCGQTDSWWGPSHLSQGPLRDCCFFGSWPKTVENSKIEIWVKFW